MNWRETRFTMDLDQAVRPPSRPSSGSTRSPPPSPCSSHNDSPPIEEGTLVSVSTTFYPGAQHQSLPPDAILLSSDSVFFYVHTNLLLSVSENAFDALLPAPRPVSPDQDPIVDVPETSTVLNIILHAVYSLSCAHYSPSFGHLCSAVRRLPIYGIRPIDHTSPISPLFSLLLSHAPLFPLELYALAASFDLYDLAVATSSHLLSLPLFSLTDEMADAIGPIYLKRLFFLHFGRSDALRRVLLPPPNPHTPTASCDFSDQKKLTRAWALASAYLAWDARPGTSFKPLVLQRSLMSPAPRSLDEHDRISIASPRRASRL